MFDDGDTLDEIAENLLEEGDRAPYDMDAYVGGETNLNKPLTRGMTTVCQPQAGGMYLPTGVIGAFDAPCGLLQTSFTSDQDSVIYHVIIDVALGSYKGIKALPL